MKPREKKKKQRKKEVPFKATKKERRMTKHSKKNKAEKEWNTEREKGYKIQMRVKERETRNKDREK